MADEQRSDEITPLTSDDVTRFCAYLYKSTGMNFTEVKRYYIDRRIAERMQASALEKFIDYFGFLRSNANELQELINIFTVNETYFYREERHFSGLTRNLLPAIVTGKNPGDKIRIWVAPCATGEEAYSIAIWLLENWPVVDAYHVEIVGSDINTRSLDQARDGDYGERSLSRLPQHLIDRYFEPSGEKQWRLIRDLQESVIFTTANIIDATSLAPHGKFDVILCRNVLIYFDDAARVMTIKNLRDRLVSGGYLILGQAESMGRTLDGFRTLRCDEIVVYQRTEENG